MKKLYFLCLTFMIASLSFGQDLVITGIIDGPLPGGTPKGLELYVINDIADLSIYGIESTTNGAAANMQEYTFPADAATAGSFIYLASEVPNFTQYLGVAPTYTDGVIAVNGDDTVILYQNGTIVDSIGEIGVDGTGTDWDHLDGWAYRVDGTGPNATFDSSEWTFSGPNALDGCDLGDDTGTNAGCTSIFPIGTYSQMPNTDPTITITSPIDNEDLDAGTTSVDVEFSVFNAPTNATVNITVIQNGGTPVTTTDITSPFQITPTVNGDSFAVTVDLVDGGTIATDAVEFDVAFPCDLVVGNIVTTCDDITPSATDTYSVSIEFTGGGTSAYTIDTGGIGVVGGNNPSSDAAGIILITDVPEGTDLFVNFTGDPLNSNCDFNRNINSPNCDPQLPLPLYEGFDYTVGTDLIAASDWNNISDSSDEVVIGGPGGLTYPNFASSSQTGNHVTFDGAGSDPAIQFTAVTGGSLYASFLINITDNSSATTPGYFAILGDFDARLWTVPGANPNEYQIGISNANTVPAGGSLDPTVLTTGSTVLVVMSYDTATGVINAWVNPSDASFGGSAPTATATVTDSSIETSLDQFVIRQDSSGETPFILFDELRLGTTWADVTPTTLSTDDFNTSNFSVYPNPTSTGFVNVIGTNDNTTSVSVFDILGKQVINESLTDNRIDVSALNAGVYILKISQNDTSVTKKLVIK